MVAVPSSQRTLPCFKLTKKLTTMVFFAGYVSKCLDSTIETTVASQNSDNQKCQVWMRIDYLTQTFHANSSYHTTPLLSTNDQDPPFFLHLDPHVYPGICSALPFRPLYSLQILAALARLPSPFRFIHSLPGTTPAPNNQWQKTDCCEESRESLSLRAGVIRSSQRLALHKGRA